jgi:hypothetical protein
MAVEGEDITVRMVGTELVVKVQHGCSLKRCSVVYGTRRLINGSVTPFGGMKINLKITS